MVIRFTDPTDELKDRKRAIDTAEYAPVLEDLMDERELAERKEAAKAYATENEKHFVDYCYDCIEQSVQSRKDIRRVQEDCYNVYKEHEPASYADKAEWQSRTVVPKPYQAVQFGAAAVKKAFSPNYLSVTNARNPAHGQFWKTTLEAQLDELHAEFVRRFTDAVTMGLAIGESMEMIPRWVPGVGLQFSLCEPWKIERDPAAPPRDPWGGMYWIHKEWLDWFTLKAGETQGRYRGVDAVKDGGDENPDDPMMSKEAIARRKGMIFELGKYRSLVYTTEFWGVVLDSRGNVLLPRATYTVAAGRVIGLPDVSPYPTLRWPGVGFSPLPDLLRYGGRGLLEGVLTIWEALCNIVCLHQDYLQWLINPMKEVNVDGLVDPKDAQGHPGKTYLVRDTAHGQAVVRVVQQRGRTNEVLPNAQYYDQQFQRGSFVTDGVQGLPGYRKDEPFRLAAMNLDQAMSVYALMGENIEGGAIAAIRAAAEVIQTFGGYDDFAMMFQEEELREIGVSPNSEAASGVTGVPALDGHFHVSGIQALMREAETLRNLTQVVIPLVERPAFAPYLKAYKILKALETRVKLDDEGIIVSEDEAKVIDQAQKLMQAGQMQAAQKLQELQEALGVTELIERLDALDSPAPGTREGDHGTGS